MPYIADGIHKPRKGDLVIKKEEHERYKKIKEAQRFNNSVRQNSKNYGGFTFLITKKGILQVLDPATVGRLAYLSIYLDFGNQLLLKPTNEPMRKNDLPQTLNINRQTANEFYSECIKAGLLFDHGAEGLYMNEIFYRDKSKKDCGKIRLYRKTIQRLYKQLKPREHKHFGFIVQIVPWINAEYNIVCSNPGEKNQKQIIPLTFKQICEKLGYDYRHSNRLHDALTKAIVEWEGHKQPLCGILITNTEYGKQTTLIVNPNLIYAGTKYEQIEVFERLFCPYNKQPEE